MVEIKAFAVLRGLKVLLGFPLDPMGRASFGLPMMLCKSAVCYLGGFAVCKTDCLHAIGSRKSPLRLQRRADSSAQLRCNKCFLAVRPTCSVDTIDRRAHVLEIALQSLQAAASDEPPPSLSLAPSPSPLPSPFPPFTTISPPLPCHPTHRHALSQSTTSAPQAASWQ